VQAGLQTVDCSYPPGHPRRYGATMPILGSGVIPMMSAQIATAAGAGEETPPKSKNVGGIELSDDHRAQLRKLAQAIDGGDDLFAEPQPDPHWDGTVTQAELQKEISTIVRRGFVSKMVAQIYTNNALLSALQKGNPTPRGPLPKNVARPPKTLKK
jgi:hypothetical protein